LVLAILQREVLDADKGAGSGGASGSGGAGKDDADMPAGSGDVADDVVVGD